LSGSKSRNSEWFKHRHCSREIHFKYRLKLLGRGHHQRLDCQTRRTINQRRGRLVEHPPDPEGHVQRGPGRSPAEMQAGVEDARYL